MPHFVLECSESITTIQPAAVLIEEVFNIAEASGLFAHKDIKVRIRTFDQFTIAGTQQDFIHIFAYIMEGRTTEQKAALSKAVVTKLLQLLPDVPVISMNIIDFEKAVYCNREMITQSQ